MFTGIIEQTGQVMAIDYEGKNIHFTLTCPFNNELQVDQSLSHNGVCLTVTECNDQSYKVTAIEETLLKSNLGSVKVGDKLNLERCMVMHGRLDGHIVQGHVDTVGYCKNIEAHDGSWVFTIEYDHDNPMYRTVEKGSVTINGTSLTVLNAQKHGFQVAIIPYTYEHTNFHKLQVGDSVNLEFDIIGKYVYTYNM